MVHPAASTAAVRAAGSASDVVVNGWGLSSEYHLRVGLPANHHTTTDYDKADRPTVTHQADGSTSSVDYNPDATVHETIDGPGNTTGYGYDGQGRAVSSTDPLHRTDTATLDPAGRTTTFTVDAVGHVTAIAYSDGTTPGVSFTYDADGRRLSMTDGSGTSSESYNLFGDQTSSTDGSGAVVGFGRDVGGRLTSIAYPTWRTPVQRGYNAASQLTSTTDFYGKVTTFGYDHDGANTSTVFPNGVSVTNTFDDAGRESATTATPTTGGAALVSLGYVRDAVGQVSNIAVNGAGQAFGYSAREQLASASGGAAGSGGSGTFSMDAANRPVQVGVSSQAFDAAGQQCWAVSTPVASPSCAAIPVGATRFTFDAVGQRVTSAPATGPPSSYGYDQAGRLVSAVTAAGSGVYRFDGDGARVSKTVGGVTTRFVNAGQSVLADFNNAWIYGPGGLPVEQTTGTSTSSVYFVHDQLGSTRALLTATGVVGGSYSYSPYGAATHTGSAATVLQYIGQYADAESGLLFLQARFYDPVTAQFLTVDPLTASTGTPYAYVGGNPVNAADPGGLMGIDECDCGEDGIMEGAPGIAGGSDNAAGSGGRIGGGSVEEAPAQDDPPPVASPPVPPNTAYSDAVAAGRGPCTATNPYGNKAAETDAGAGKAMSQLDRTGSGPKGDVLHRSASWVVDDSGAQQFTIRGGDGVDRELYQLPGEVNGKPGVFEWMVDDSGTDPVITHQRFINGGSVTGYPNQHP